MMNPHLIAMMENDKAGRKPVNSLYIQRDVAVE